MSTKAPAPDTSPDWLIDNIAECSKNARAIYLLYLGFLAYCTVTLFGVTDRQIVLNEGVRLPIVNVDVSLRGFFVFAPVVAFLVFVYLQLYLQRLKRLKLDLREGYRDVRSTRLYPWMLNIADRAEPGFVGGLQRFIVGLSLWWALPAVLFFFSFVFLKTHEPVWTWRLNLAPTISATVAACFWWAYSAGIRRHPFLFPLTLILTGLLATDYLNGVRHYSLAGDRARGQTVDLSYQVLIEEQNEEYDVYWLDLRKAQLQGANLTSAVLKKADLQKVNLKHAVLTRANLQDARLDSARLDSTDFTSAKLNGANFTFAKLNGANLQKARLDNANLNSTKLNGARLLEAHLDNADLRMSRLNGANLIRAKLNGTNLQDAHLYGAHLNFTKLDGANLQDAHLDSADLAHAKLNDAHLYGTRLNGAHLSEAQLDGADLTSARLNGANLDKARLNGASLLETYLNGATLRRATLTKAYLPGTRLEEASLIEAELNGTFLYRTRLAGSSLNHAQLDSALLIDTQLQGATLVSADLRGAVILIAELDSADLQRAKLHGVSFFQVSDLENSLRNLYSRVPDNVRTDIPALNREIRATFPSLPDHEVVELLCRARKLDGIEPDTLRQQLRAACPEKFEEPEP